MSEEQTFRCPSRILLVEDNPVIAMNTEVLLIDLGAAQVSIAGTVAEALRLVDAEAFDAAILDFRLGDEEDSLPIAERLGTEGIPFIFATGFDEAVELPPDYAPAFLLKKPYSFDDLARAMRSL